MFLLYRYQQNVNLGSVLRVRIWLQWGRDQLIGFERVNLPAFQHLRVWTTHVQLPIGHRVALVVDLKVEPGMRIGPINF